MSQDISLSVIIPAYNAEKTLANAVNSIVCQNTSIEIIITNDGSTDRTRQVADDLAERWNNVSLISTQNLGVSHARNVGIDSSTGDWLIFLDADDELKPNIYDDLCELMHHDEYDMIFGMKEYLSPDKRSCPVHRELSDTGDPLEAISCSDVLESLLSLSEDSLSGSCTRTLYKRKWLIDQKIKFPEGIKLGEDKCYLMSCLERLPRVGKVGLLFYRANQNYSSVTRGYIVNLAESIRYMDECTVNAVTKFSKLRHLLQPNFAQSAWISIDNAAKHSLQQTLSVSRNVYASNKMRDAIRATQSHDKRVSRRIKLLKMGLCFPWLLAIILRCKRRFEGFKDIGKIASNEKGGME